MIIKLDDIISLLPAQIFWMNREGVYLGANQAVLDFLKLNDKSEFIGRTVEDFIGKQPIETIRQIRQQNEEIIRTGQPITTEHKGVDRNGNEVWYLIDKMPLRDQSTGEVIGVLGVGVNITERKKMEEELRRSAEELRESQQQKETSEAASFAKSHFLNNMRHDVRTPLSCIVGSARVLKKMEDNSEKMEFIDGILDCSESLLNMITHMLEYDTMMARERPVKLELVKIKKLSRDLLLMVNFAAKRKGIDIELNIADDVPECLETDTYRIQRILLNLITNAIKFTNEGTVSLNVAIKQQDMKSLALNIAVHDTGIGIPKDKHHIIFDKFVRLNTIEKNSEYGEGLGLSIVRQYVNELGGSIAISSTLGEGSTFYLTVPCRRAAVMQKESAL